MNGEQTIHHQTIITQQGIIIQITIITIIQTTTEITTEKIFIMTIIKKVVVVFNVENLVINQEIAQIIIIIILKKIKLVMNVVKLVILLNFVLIKKRKVIIIMILNVDIVMN